MNYFITNEMQVQYINQHLKCVFNTRYFQYKFVIGCQAMFILKNRLSIPFVSPTLLNGINAGFQIYVLFIDSWLFPRISGSATLVYFNPMPILRYPKYYLPTSFPYFMLPVMSSKRFISFLLCSLSFTFSIKMFAV